MIWKMFTIHTADGQTFQVDINVIRKSLTLTDMLNQIESQTEENKTLQINIQADDMVKV